MLVGATMHKMYRLMFTTVIMASAGVLLTHGPIMVGVMASEEVITVIRTGDGEDTTTIGGLTTVILAMDGGGQETGITEVMVITGLTTVITTVTIVVAVDITTAILETIQILATPCEVVLT